MSVLCLHPFYWTHVNAFLNIFNQFRCWYNYTLFYTVIFGIFLTFYWWYKKIIGYDSMLLKKIVIQEIWSASYCLSSLNLTWTPLQFIAIPPVKISKGCCHFVPNCYVHEMYMYYKNPSNTPLCSSISQSSINSFSWLL